MKMDPFLDMFRLEVGPHTSTAKMSSSAFFLERDSNGSWATCNPYNQQLFFCINNECSNIASAGEQCDSCNGGNETEYDRWESTLTREPNWDTSECPGCGREQHGAMLGSNGYCGPCWQQRYGLLGCSSVNSVDAESLRHCKNCDIWYNIKDDDEERAQCYQCDKYDWDEACAEQAALSIKLPKQRRCIVCDDLFNRHEEEDKIECDECNAEGRCEDAPSDDEDGRKNPFMKMFCNGCETECVISDNFMRTGICDSCTV